MHQFFLIKMSTVKKISSAVIISDCIDENARVRQQCRFASLFSVEPSYIGVSSQHPELEAAGHLVDVLDANRCISLSFSSCSLKSDAPANSISSIVIVNVAPRSEAVKKRWDNGIPFCYFVVGSVLVVSTYSIKCLSLVRNLGLLGPDPALHLMSVDSVMQWAVSCALLSPEDGSLITNSQFRSYEFVPLASYLVVSGFDVPFQLVPLDHDRENDGEAGPPSQGFVWFADNFGNCKTSFHFSTFSLEPGMTVLVNDTTKATFWKRLADAPSLVPSLVVGSSGYGECRFLELVIKGGNFAKTFGVSIGPVSVVPSEASSS